MIILLDTNFLITAVKHKIADQIKGLGGQLAVPETVYKELKKPSLGPEAIRNAAAALLLLNMWRVKVLPTSVKNVDNSLIEVSEGLKAKGEEVFVATLDEELKKRLHGKSIKTISIKREKRIEKD